MTLHLSPYYPQNLKPKWSILWKRHKSSHLSMGPIWMSSIANFPCSPTNKSPWTTKSCGLSMVDGFLSLVWRIQLYFPKNLAIYLTGQRWASLLTLSMPCLNLELNRGCNFEVCWVRTYIFCDQILINMLAFFLFSYLY